MQGVNRVSLLGNLGADPEVRFLTSGSAVANLKVATNESWVDKQGQRQTKTEWHRVVAWGKLAQLAGEYLSKGRQVYVEGKLQTREWTDKENRKNYTTEIVATSLVFLGGGKREDDIPFPAEEREDGASMGVPLASSKPHAAPDTEDVPF